MSRTSSLVLALALLGVVQPVFGDGLLSSMVRYEPIGEAPTAQAHPADLLSDPATIRPGTALVAIGYNAEALLRTRTGGKITADMSTSEASKSLLLPMRLRGKPLTLAFSQTSFAGSLFYDDPELGSDLELDGDSSSWAVVQSVGTGRIGLAGSRYSGTCEGMSLAPQSYLKTFTAEANVHFDLSRQDVLLQLMYPVGNRSRIRLTSGIGDWRAALDIAREATRVTIPIRTDVRRYGAELETRLNANVMGRIGYDESAGSGTDFITKNDRKMGRLESAPGSSRFDISLQYQGKPNTTWEAGWVSSQQSLGLAGYGLNGNELGLNIKPFADKVDFDAAIYLRTAFYHVGMKRTVSDEWEIGARYKLIHVGSTVDGDYVGRGFLGLVSVSGTYDWTPISSTVHGIELSAVYTHGGLTAALSLQQLIPEADDTSHASHGPPKPSSRSTGGTSISISSSYAF